MSHELRTPLHAIIGFSEMLLEQMYGELNERQSRYQKHVLDAGRHLLSLINDILDLSKVEAGRMDLDREPFVLSEVLQAGLVVVRERARDRGIGLELCGSGDRHSRWRRAQDQTGDPQSPVERGQVHA
jgi:signal transduction histidine kinase